MATAIVAHRGSYGIGHLVEMCNQLLDRLARHLRMARNRVVQVVHVSLMVLVVMQMHRLRIEVRFERVISIRQVRQFERAGRSGGCGSSGLSGSQTLCVESINQRSGARQRAHLHHRRSATHRFHRSILRGTADRKGYSASLVSADDLAMVKWRKSNSSPGILRQVMQLSSFHAIAFAG